MVRGLKLKGRQAIYHGSHMNALNLYIQKYEKVVIQSTLMPSSTGAVSISVSECTAAPARATSGSVSIATWLFLACRAVASRSAAGSTAF